MTRYHGVWLLCLMMMSACGGSDSESVVGGPADTSTAQQDTGVIDEDIGGAGADTGATDASEDTSQADTQATDTGASDGQAGDTNDSCPGGDGCPCADNGECNGGVCLDTHEGKRCAAKCTDTCAKGYACKDIGDGTPLFYCVSTRISLCSPCQFHSDCQINGVDSLCVEYGGEGKFCGSPCTESADCPTGYSCSDVPNGAAGDVKQCVKDGEGDAPGLCECSDWAVAKGASTTCSVSNDAGKCTAKRSCDASGLSACSAATPAVETCNGVDDDCDGKTDTLPADATCTIKAFKSAGSQKACTADSDCGAPGEACDPADKLCKEVLGACPGTPSCDASGKLICSGAATPKVETCDSIDNDCDGQTDEDFTWAVAGGAALKVGDSCGVGACAGGKVTCASVSAATCASLSQASTETCDNVDNDCDGLTDNAACDDGDACTTDKCDGAQSKCTNTVAVNCDDSNGCTKDTCDKITGKCANAEQQGSCDDGNACTVGDTCGKDPSDGKHTCLPGVDKLKCDDSNPCTDDTCEPSKGCVSAANAGSQPCYSGAPKTKGVGICKAGVSFCKDGKLQGNCVGEVLPKPKELCDGKDHTCDGVKDEGCAPTGVDMTFISAKISGKTGKIDVDMLVGQSSPTGDSSGGKYGLKLGFLAWLQAWTK